MKKRNVFIFALFLSLTGFRGESKIVEQNNVNYHERVTYAGEALKIINSLGNVMANEGDDVIFTATVSTVNYEVTWFKNDEQIEENDIFKLFINKQTATLLIKDVHPEDAGEYTVVFKNRNGEVKSTAYLFVVLSE